MSDKKGNLWELLRQGDEGSWEDLFKQHYGVLCHFAAQFVQDRFTAEALVGDVLYKIWERRSDLEIHDSLRAYLLRAVRNRCMNYLKSFNRKRMRQFSSFAAEELEQMMISDYEGHLLELEEEVEKAVARLPEQCRLIFEKSRKEHMKYEEIARILGISVNTVKFHMKKALSLLRESLSKYLAALLALFLCQV